MVPEINMYGHLLGINLNNYYYLILFPSKLFSDSIWNHAIGSDAEYVAAGINGSSHFDVDNDIWIVTSSSDPKIKWYPPYSWDERCKVGSQKVYPIEVPWPESTIVPDADPPSTPNYAAAILLPDGKSLLQAEPLCRDESGSTYPMFGYSPSCAQNLDTANYTSIYSGGTDTKYMIICTYLYI